MGKKLLALATLAMLAVPVMAADYTENTTISGLINMVYDLVGTILLVLMGFAGAIIGIGILTMLVVSIKFLIDTILGLVYGFGKRRR